MKNTIRQQLREAAQRRATAENQLIFVFRTPDCGYKTFNAQEADRFFPKLGTYRAELICKAYP